MQTEMDNNENHVIQGLEALLGGEEVPEVSHSKSFEDMRTKFRDSFSLDQSKDSGVTFSNLSFRHGPSLNTSIQNVSNFFYSYVKFISHLILLHTAIHGVRLFL